MSKKKLPKKPKYKNKLPKIVQNIITETSQTSQISHEINYYKRPSNAEIIDALVKTRNNKTEAGKILDVDRKTIKFWLDTDLELQKELKEVQDEVLEWVMSKEFELIEGVYYLDPKLQKVYKVQPCWRSVQHYIDSQGKHLGFGDDKSIKINNTLTANQNNSKQRIILEVPKNGRNTNPTTDTGTNENPT